jgi:hypothetical protein
MITWNNEMTKWSSKSPNQIQTTEPNQRNEIKTFAKPRHNFAASIITYIYKTKCYINSRISVGPLEIWLCHRQWHAVVSRSAARFVFLLLLALAVPVLRVLGDLQRNGFEVLLVVGLGWWWGWDTVTKDEEDGWGNFSGAKESFSLVSWQYWGFPRWLAWVLVFFVFLLFHVSEIDLFVFIDMLDTSKPASYSCSSSDRWTLSWKKWLQVKWIDLSGFRMRKSVLIGLKGSYKLLNFHGFKVLAFFNCSKSWV